jgi:hypothetical protein
MHKTYISLYFCGRTAWIIPVQVRRPSLYRWHDLDALQMEQPNGMSGNIPMKPPDSGSSSVLRTMASPKIQAPLHFYNIVIVVITNRFLVKYYKPNWNKFIQTLFENFKFQRTLFRDGSGKDIHLYTYTLLSSALGSQALPGEPHMTGRGATRQLGYFMDLLQMGRVMLDGQGCHHLPSISSNNGIGPHPATLTSPDTTSTLMSDTLAYRA